MKRTLICASIVSVLAAVASAQPAITWQSPLAISTDTDVSTLGTQLFGWAPFNGSPQNVNGVSFSSSPPNFSPSAGFDQSYNAYPPSPSGTSAYNSDLAFGTYTVNGTIAFSWNTMTSGHTYQIQLWDST